MSRGGVSSEDLAGQSSESDENRCHQRFSALRPGFWGPERIQPTGPAGGPHPHRSTKADSVEPTSACHRFSSKSELCPGESCQMFGWSSRWTAKCKTAQWDECPDGGLFRSKYLVTCGVGGG